MDDAQREYVVHIRRHCGWHTTREVAPNFSDAAIRAVVRTCKEFDLDVDKIPHRVEFQDDEYPYVTFWETSHRPVAFGRMQQPGDLWFSDRVREGAEDDCHACGGTGVNFYNPFVQCWKCGDQTAKGQSSGKQAAT